MEAKPYSKTDRIHRLKLPPANKKGEGTGLNFVYRYLYGGPPFIYTVFMRVRMVI